MTVLVYSMLILVALLLVWGHYGHFTRFGDPADPLGWRACLGDLAVTTWPTVYLTWEAHPIRKPARPEFRVESRQAFLAYPAALTVRWGAFRLVALGRLK